jgi:hypothetical protein
MEPEGSLPCSQELTTGPYPEPDRSTPYHPILSLRSILILSTHLRFGLTSSIFPSGFPNSILHAVLFYTIRATCPPNCIIIIIDLINIIILGEEYKLRSSSLCSFLQPPVTSPLFGPNILNTLFTNTLSLCSSLNVRDKVSLPYRTTVKIVVLYILIFMFLDSRWENKIFWTKW